MRWTLQELEIPFDPEVVDLTAGEHCRPAFLQLNPAGKLPVLVDGDVVLTESVAIVLYLAEKHPEKRRPSRACLRQVSGTRRAARRGSRRRRVRPAVGRGGAASGSSW